jgi:WD40 repeat protein
MKKMEDEFNNVFNENLNKTVQSLESIISVLSKTLDDFKKKMEIKMNKKNLVMSILKKVYEIYYDDIKRVKDGYKNITTLKFLSKEYSEFSDISFRSDLDLLVNKLDKIKGALEKEDVNNIIRISYAYFSKKELNLTTIIKDEIKEPITDIIELKEGKIIISSEDNLIRIYDEKGSLLNILKGHSNGVRSLCQMKDGKLASGSSDKTIRIWDLKQNKTINILKEHSNPIISLNILHNDKLASCSFRDIIIYDDKLKPQYILQDHSNWVRNIIQLDKLKSCSVSDDCTIKIYDKHFRVLNSFKDHNAPVLSVCLLRDGRLVTGDKKGKIIIWNKSLTNTQELKQHNLGILSIKQIKDGRICTASIDKTIKIWDIDFKGLFVFKNHSAPVNCLCILKDGGLASGGADAVVNIWR